jgi:hypothetical protein
VKLFFYPNNIDIQTYFLDLNMKKLFSIVIIALLTVTFVQAQTGWVTHRADNRISLKFPTEPSEKAPGSFIAAAKDSTVAYVFTMVDFVQVANIDSVALAPIKATPEFAAQLKVGIAQSLPTVDLSDFAIGTWRGFTSYTATGTDPQKKQYNIFMVIIGNKLYSFSTIRKSGAGTEGPDTFLKSIVLSN